jgi:hypothetical protein
MHFRERGQVIQIIRTVRDSKSRKGKSKLLGRLQKSKLHISEELATVLTAEERKEVAAWIKGQATAERLKKELAVRTLPEQMALAGQWFAEQKTEDSQVMAAALVPAWTRLRVILNRSGLLE